MRGPVEADTFLRVKISRNLSFEVLQYILNTTIFCTNTSTLYIYCIICIYSRRVCDEGLKYFKTVQLFFMMKMKTMNESVRELDIKAHVQISIGLDSDRSRTSKERLFFVPQFIEKPT